MKAIKPINLLERLFTNRRGCMERLKLKQKALADFENTGEAQVWGEDAASERRNFLINEVSQERQRLYEIGEDIYEAASMLVNERAGEETKRLLQLQQESAKAA